MPATEYFTGGFLSIPQIFASQPDGKEQGSLFKLLDKTVTAFGQRRLREWVSRSLTCYRTV